MSALGLTPYEVQNHEDHSVAAGMGATPCGSGNLAAINAGKIDAGGCPASAEQYVWASVVCACIFRHIDVFGLAVDILPRPFKGLIKQNGFVPNIVVGVCQAVQRSSGNVRSHQANGVFKQLFFRHEDTPYGCFASPTIAGDGVGAMRASAVAPTSFLFGWAA